LTQLGVAVKNFRLMSMNKSWYANVDR
jgi:hypothetical protein